MKASLVFTFLIVVSISIYSQPGTLDPTFGAGGKVITVVGSGSGVAKAIAIQKDGKIVTAGQATNGPEYFFALTRHNIDGSPDLSFDGDGRVTTSIGANYNEALSIAIQNDGKILAAGLSDRGSLNGNALTDFALVRYKIDGSLDSTFDFDGKVTTAFGEQAVGNAVAIQNDGKIVVAGTSDGRRIAVARYNSDGSLDVSFGTNGKVLSLIGASTFGNIIAIQPDGKILVGGTGDNGVRFSFAVLRYNTNGTLDPSFGVGGVAFTDFGTFSSSGRALGLYSDGKIVLAGYSETNIFGTLASTLALAKYNSDGSPDLSFDGDGKLTTQFDLVNGAASVEIQTDGKIIVGGSTYRNGYADSRLLRYNPNGSLDETFGYGGIMEISLDPFHDIVNALELNSSRIYAAGFANGIMLAAFKNDGLPIACSNDNLPPIITTRNVTVKLDATGKATIQPSNVIQSVIDNCAVDNASITVSPNTFTCANLASTGSHQAYIAGTNSGNQDFYGELGLEFTVNAADGIIINQLGAFDDQGNGISGTQNGGIRVAVFNKSTHLPVPGLDVIVSGNADSYRLNYRFKNITPVSLPQGTYVIVAKGYNLYEKNGNADYGGGPYPTGDLGTGAIHFGTTKYWGENTASGFSFPKHSANGNVTCIPCGKF
ncbi:hypothetical protein EXU57_23075 [Segetibacter sp. 3557_3]|uniref:delta-60 repeat domain-containing protein n=1 Tax=Segetibacter sp. 3557_3 TaxID=2547429 RepID=UPI001058BD3A|nr:delta-60 repeat domain-containing protein [Segetibacter sp. 3557_3]TDH18484.1 hypothetical protein EXU57_23075 [Segetibacter sp. 3557_3]